MKIRDKISSPRAVGLFPLMALICVCGLMCFSLLALYSADCSLKLAQRTDESARADYAALGRAQAGLNAESGAAGDTVEYSEPVDDNRTIVLTGIVGADGRVRVISRRVENRQSGSEFEEGQYELIP